MILTKATLSVVILTKSLVCVALQNQVAYRDYLISLSKHVRLVPPPINHIYVGEMWFEHHLLLD